MGRTALIYETAGRFSAALGEGGGALLGLDLGTQRIGLAICDASWRYASALETLPRGKFARDVAKLESQISKRQIAGLVLGLPRNMDGSEGARAQSARAYAVNLQATLGLPLLLWDERWSTQSADSAMIAQDISRTKRAQRIDSHAAAVILQGALDAMTGAAF